MIEEINIKEDFPPVDVAVANVENEIEVHKKFGERVIKIVHGYGSHGVGGLIRVTLRERLKELKRNKTIVDFIAGERLTKSIITELDIAESLKIELMMDKDCDCSNAGITVIIIK